MSYNFTSSAWPYLIHEDLNGSIGFGTRVSWTLDTLGNGRIAIPLILINEEEIDKFEAFVSTGTSAALGFRCRIVNANSANCEPDINSLADVNASKAITATANAWNIFDFTNFTLNPGFYYILLDTPSPPSVSLTIHYNLDYSTNTTNSINLSPLYWTGTAWAHDATRRGLRVRLKAASGWVPLPVCAPLGGRTGLNAIIMDKNENPSCRGNRWKAPASGTISGFRVSIAAFSTDTSFKFVLANQGCTTALASAEIFRKLTAGGTGYVDVLFTPTAVISGTLYDCYVTAGLSATTIAGVSIVALDTSEDSGTTIGSYGVEPGDILGLSVHNPPTEGGAGSVTVTSDHVYPWSPIYSYFEPAVSPAPSSTAQETSSIFFA